MTQSVKYSLPIMDWAINLKDYKSKLKTAEREKKDFFSEDICFQRPQIPKSTTEQSDIKEDNLVFHLSGIEKLKRHLFVRSLDWRRNLVGPC